MGEAPAFAVGDVVNIEIQGARVVWQRDNVLAFQTSRDDDPMICRLEIGPGRPEHTVTRVAPAEFPPQPGDVWRMFVMRHVPVNLEAWERRSGGNGYTAGFENREVPLLVTASGNSTGEWLTLTTVGAYMFGNPLDADTMLTMSTRAPELVSRLSDELRAEIQGDEY
jgi:hypothetical protein